jgi:DNA-binding NarL/FixJ family response regulator
MQDSRQIRARILVVDDHELVVDGICSILRNNYEIVGVAADGRELLDKAPKVKPDVIVLDICMPLLNGLDAARHLKEFLPKLKFVFLTMRDDRNLAAAALKLGPVGFVLKHSAASELQKAISEILLGKSYVTPKLRPDDWAVGEERAKQFSKELSPRQREVLQLLAEGRPMKEVANILSVSEKTVNFHKYHMMQTFDLRNNADLVLFALKQGLISA